MKWGVLPVLTAAALLLLVRPSEASEGFGFFKQLVMMQRAWPPEVILPVKRLRVDFVDSTHRASALRQRIESQIRSRDPQMQIATDAPYVLTISVSGYLGEKPLSIDGTYRLSDRAGRIIDKGRVSASNAGSLITASEDALIDDAADDAVRIIAPSRGSSAVVMPKGRFEQLIPLAERGDWPGYLSAVQRMPALRDDSDAYRHYALAIGYEGIGHQSASLDSKVFHLREAIRENLIAARMKPGEKLFREAHVTLKLAADPPMVSVRPREMERWQSMLLVQKWMMAPPLPQGTADNRSVLALLAAGRSDQAVLAEISRAREVRFSLDQNDMMALYHAGVPWPVIDRMRSRAGLPPGNFAIPPETW